MKKFVIGLMTLVVLPLFVFSKYEVKLKLDKILNESQIENEMKPEGDNGFTDDWFSIGWVPSPSEFAFALMNKSNASLYIVWDESAFINENGVSSKVMNEGVKFADKGQSIPPTNIPLMAKIQDAVLPVDYWYFGGAKKIGWGSAVQKWRNNPIWDEEIKDKEFEELKNKDLIFRVILNVKKGEEKRNYHFFFKAFAKKI